jgi:hypothetical protein
MSVLLFAKLISTEESLAEVEVNKVFGHCMETIKGNLGQHALKTDICIEALAYLSLKEVFKKSFLVQNLSVVCSNVDSLSY